MQVVVQSLEQTVTEVHVTDGVDVLEVNTSGQLAVVMSPVVLDALHVPLVDDHNDFLGWVSIDGSEQVIVSLVNDDTLLVREEYVV